VGGATTGEWRLPEIGEYMDLWTEVGGSLSGLETKFINVQSHSYWSGTEYAPNPNTAAWGFRISGIHEVDYYRFSGLYAVAVRPGDVAASVPEPQTLALALLALGETAVVRRRRSR
jgi:hypothetical protein